MVIMGQDTGESPEFRQGCPAAHNSSEK